MNNLSISGRLGRDPETRATSNGKALSNFSLAVDYGFGDKKTTSWFNVVAFGKTAELVQQYLKSGSKVGISGRIQSRQYEKDGQKRTSFEIIANEVEFLDSKPAGTAAVPTEYVPDDSDIPF